jgi:hypothetical protein
MARYSSSTRPFTAPELSPSISTQQYKLAKPGTPNSPLPSSEPFALAQNGTFNTDSSRDNRHAKTEMIFLTAVVEKPAADDVFTRFLKRKAEKDVEAKKIALAQTSQQSPTKANVDTANYATSSTPWAPPRPARFMKDGRHPHFTSAVGDQGIDNFQHFLKEKGQQEVVNGKRYLPAPTSAASREPIQQPVTAAEPRPKNIGDVQPTASKFGGVDRHSIFSPGNLPTGINNGSTPQVSKTSNIQVSPCTEQEMAILFENSKPRMIIDPAPEQSIPASDYSVAKHESNSAITSTSGSYGRWKANKQNCEANDQTILGELMVSKQSRADITQDIMLEGWGSDFPEHSVNSFENKISDTGIEELSKENVRGAQGKDAAEELLDWDKSWLPPPCVWEERGIFDTSFIPDYIRKDWQPNLAAGTVWFELDDPDFQLGRCIVNNKQLDDPPIHPDTTPGTLCVLSHNYP